MYGKVILSRSCARDGRRLIVANSYKARSLVKKSQAELMQKMDEMMDEKLKGEQGPKEETAEKKSKK